MAWVLVVALLGTCSASQGTPAGLKVRVTQEALEYGQQFGLELLKSVLQKEPIPDLNGSYSIPLFGTVAYSVSRVRIQELQLNESTVGFSEGTGVRLVVQHAHVRLGGDWAVQTWAVHDSGSFDISVHDLSLSTVLGVSRGPGGHFSVWSDSCESSVHSLDVTFRTGASWLYNLFTGALRGPLQTELNKHLCPELRKGVERLERVLETMRVSAQIDPVAELDYSLVQRPTITAQHGDVDLKGEVYRVGAPQESPFSPGPVLLPGSDGRMLLLAASQALANSAAFVYFTAGTLQRRITDSMIHKRSPLRLNTMSMGVFAPKLLAYVPAQPMELHLAARKQPLLSCRPGALDLALFGTAKAFVVLPNATLAPAFLLDVDANLTGKLLVDSARVGGSVALKNFRMSQVESHVGPVKVKDLEAVMNLALRAVGMSLVNKRLKKGFPVPSFHNISLVEPHVSIHEGFVLVATDMRYESERPKAAAQCLP
ncbi:bactericidal permeability-increasing protein [Alligator mississippiensis]|uniref:bactericidal permeability-increasing protein n=1 Tax=Alligator mississippiensis TaxID=8496 RepID=UPI0007116E53|nr:bactericidal permeability-increasing protein [Alligator mississippiensis]XP_019355881.2 bactericidal permeability-increasing protein [Alligator mississippiensis]XP_059569119.1 bactericidal permeability-increasing protein [Alligator mississippiensis]XP_059569120.1 bactericidal permeability-increasing protein [Alligator mississippiensis]